MRNRLNRKDARTQSVGCGERLLRACASLHTDSQAANCIDQLPVASYQPVLATRSCWHL